LTVTACRAGGRPTRARCRPCRPRRRSPGPGLHRRAADHLLVRQAGQLLGAAAAADDAALLVADEERRVGRGVVVVEQLEEEAEAALRAALGWLRKPAVRSVWVDRCRSWGQMNRCAMTMGRLVGRLNGAV
jgi:RNase P/RNase MRP subunit POP5